MSTLFNGNKRVKININSETFSRGWFSYLTPHRSRSKFTSPNFRAAEAAKKIQHLELNYPIGIVR